MAGKSPKRSALSKDRRSGRPVRLDLAPADHERLARAAKARGLTKAAFARQAVLAAIKADNQ